MTAPSGLRSSLLVLIIGASVAACGSTPSEPSGQSLVITRLTLAPHQLILLPVGDSIKLNVSARDQQGETFSPGAGYFVWRSDPAVGRVAGGETFVATAVPGATWLVAETPTGVRDSVMVETYHGNGAFHITLLYAADIPVGWRTELERAARRWEARMTGELPAIAVNSDGGSCGNIQGEPTFPHQAGDERGVRIYVRQSGQFPAGTYAEAVGGPCLQRPPPLITTILGAITLNRDKPLGDIAQPRLEYLALHEMGHALGLVGVFQGSPVPWFDPATGHYTGAEALEGWRRTFGSSVSSLQTSAHHWLAVENWDVMGVGGGLGSTPPISLTTVGALMDMGYPATWAIGPFD